MIDTILHILVIGHRSWSLWVIGSMNVRVWMARSKKGITAHWQWLVGIKGRNKILPSVPNISHQPFLQWASIHSVSLTKYTKNLFVPSALMSPLIQFSPKAASTFSAESVSTKMTTKPCPSVQIVSNHSTMVQSFKN